MPGPFNPHDHSTAQNSFPHRKSGAPLRARGARYWTVKGRLLYKRNSPEAWEEAMRRRIREADKSHKESLKKEVERAAFEAQKRAGQYGRSRSVQNTPMLGKGGSAASDQHTGKPAGSRVKGKKRSVALGDVTKPSLELQEGETPDRRIGALAGSHTGRQRGTAIFANVGANKDFGDGWAGKSAGRIRGAVNAMKHPETFMTRFAWVYLAKHVTQGIINWRGWDKVAWSNSQSQATGILAEHDSGGVAAIPAFIAGTLAATGLRVASITSPIGAFIASGGDEAQAARAVSYLDAWATYLSSGGRGTNPGIEIFGLRTGAAAEFEGNAVARVETIQRKARKIAVEKFEREVEANLTKYQDADWVMGLGGVNTVRTLLRRTPEYKQASEAVGRAASNSVDVQKAQEDIMNRILTGNKPKR